MKRDKASRYILVKLHDSSCSFFVTLHSRYRRQTTDNGRQHLIEIAELAMQLQRSAKNYSELIVVNCAQSEKPGYKL